MSGSRAPITQDTLNARLAQISALKDAKAAILAHWPQMIPEQRIDAMAYLRDADQRIEDIETAYAEDVVDNDAHRDAVDQLNRLGAAMAEEAKAIRDVASALTTIARLIDRAAQAAKLFATLA